MIMSRLHFHKFKHNFEKWLDVMKEELKSMKHNDVWNLVELPEDYKRICNWVFKPNVNLMTIINVIKPDLL